MPSHQPSDITAEFEIDSTDNYVSTYGGYDLAERVRGGDSVRITRGLVDQQSSVSASQCVFTLNNPDGLFNDDNPYSPLFGRFGSNTRVRHGIKTSAGTWDEYVRFAEGIGAQRVWTADKASLDITGDIDIRVEFTANYMRGYANLAQVLAGKYDITGNQRSWYLSLRPTGEVRLSHSPDGTLASSISAVSDKLPYASGRIAVRVTLDVNNGAAGKTWTYYTAPTIAGPWTQLGSSITTAGTTSIFSSTADLEVGSANENSGPFVNETSIVGKIHAFEMYNGIGGTLVADFKPQGRGLTNGTTTPVWNDTCASPNTWTVTGEGLRLASSRVRFCGEINSTPDTWDVSGRDGFQTITALGPLGRLSTSKGNLRSAIYRNYSKYPDLVGYWPMEDESGATQAGSAISGVGAGQIVNCTFGSTTGLAGSAGSLTLTSAPNISYARMTTPVYQSTTASSFLFYYRMDTLPGSVFTFVTLTAYGTVRRWTIGVGASSYTFTGYNSTGGTVVTYSVAFGSQAPPLDAWVGMQLWLRQEGGNVRLQTAWHGVGSNTFYTHFGGGTTYVGTVGEGFQQVTFDTPDAAFAGAQIAHVIMSNSDDLDLVSVRFRDASKAYDGELAGRRMQRLANEEGVYFEWLGHLDDTPAVGPQQIASLYTNFTAAAGVDQGLLGECRDIYGLVYINRAYLGNRAPLELDYSLSHLAETPRPTNDQRYTVNDFTANRPAGSSARYVEEGLDGRRKNVNDPPVGIGRYENSGTFNASTDAQLTTIAQSVVNVGTWPDRRIPNLSIANHRSEIFSNAVLLADVIDMDFGDLVTVTGMEAAPRQVPPDDIRTVVFGYTETYNNKLWSLVANTVPAGPYTTPIIEDPVGEYPRLDATDTVLLADYSTSATSLRIGTFTGPAWVDSTSYASEFPFDVEFGGERMMVTAATASTTTALRPDLDGTFESTLDWDGANGTVTRSNTFAQAGTWSGLLTVAGPVADSHAFNDSLMPIPVKAGASYTLNIYVRSAVALTDVRIFIDWYDENMTYPPTTVDSGTAALASGSWVLRTLTATAPANARYAYVGPWIYGSPLANGTLLYFDSITFTTTAAYHQTLTVTRSVNTVAKTQTAGTQGFLAEPSYLGLGDY